jgi:hypothetical protein
MGSALLGYPGSRKNGGHSGGFHEAPRPNTSFAPLGYPRWEKPGGHEPGGTIFLRV